MLIRKSFFISFLLMYSWISIGQNLNHAIYDVQIDEERFSKFISNGEFNSMEIRLYRKLLNEVNRTQLSLSFDKNNSIFQPIEQMSIGGNSSTKITRSALLILLGLENVTYFDKKIDSLYLKRGEGEIVHLVKIKADSPDWEITNSEKIVNHLVYRKATSELTKGLITYSIEAWFCPDISNQFGPGSFFGLPGLITEVYVKDKHYSYSIILRSLKNDKKTNPVIIPIEKYDVYSEQESQALFSKSKFSNN